MGPICEKRALLDVMIGSMLHEGFYTRGAYCDERLGLALGWVSHTQSFSDCLPVWNETKDIGLIFSGEDFPEKQDLDDLRAKGHQFAADDASSLVHLYEEKGSRFLEELNGWFSGVLIDLREGKSILFNDRYGLERLYVHEAPDAFYFASEAKALLKAVPRLRALDMQSLAEFCSCGCALQNRTLFTGISLLPGASKWTFFRSQQAKKEIYFRRETWESQSLIEKGQFNERLKQTFSRILPKYFRGSRRIGMSLTGGLDGRMIMAWARRPAGSLPCYTFGGIYRDCADVRIARRVAEACHQPHQVIPVDRLFFPRFRECAERAVYISDGAMDVTASVELYVNELARSIAPVRMTGNYGSEILRGNIAFKPQSVSKGFYNPEFECLIRGTAKTFAQEREGHPLSFIAFKQIAWHHRSRLSVEQSQLTMRSPYLDNELVALMYQAPRELVMSKGPSLRVIADANSGLSRIPTDHGLVYPPVPLATPAWFLFQKLTFKLDYAFDYGMPQWFAPLDQKLAPLHLERLFLGRHKFFHFRVWYRDELCQDLKDILLDGRTRSRPYLQGAKLEDLVKRHVGGDRNYTSDIHRILSTELIQRKLIEL
jgi:asparagine synthase (glutamine-hydrolysing)